VLVGVTDCGPSIAVRALLDQILQAGIHAARLPAEAQRDMQGVQTEIIHDARRPAELGTALPIDWLAWIEVAGVPEMAFRLDDPAEAAGADHVNGSLRAGEEGHLARATNEPVRIPCEALGNLRRRRRVDPEGLLGQEVLACVEGSAVHVSVQVMAYSDVHDVD